MILFIQNQYRSPPNVQGSAAWLGCAGPDSVNLAHHRRTRQRELQAEARSAGTGCWAVFTLWMQLTPLFHFEDLFVLFQSWLEISDRVQYDNPANHLHP